ncbi:MAG: hypothetical protein PHE27_05165, partial [Alphaproteobacteria bacterium]|nr:hypothetical protein [Alphaproteobacteria bacterium]
AARKAEAARLAKQKEAEDAKQAKQREAERKAEMEKDAKAIRENNRYGSQSEAARKTEAARLAKQREAKRVAEMNENAKTVREGNRYGSHTNTSSKAEPVKAPEAKETPTSGNRPPIQSSAIKSARDLKLARMRETEISKAKAAREAQLARKRAVQHKQNEALNRNLKNSGIKTTVPAKASGRRNLTELNSAKNTAKAKALPNTTKFKREAARRKTELKPSGA